MELKKAEIELEQADLELIEFDVGLFESNVGLFWLLQDLVDDGVSAPGIG